MKKYIFIAIISVFGFLISCSEDAPEFKTRQVYRSDLYLTAGFNWFEARVNLYNCNSAYLSQLQAAYKPTKHSFLFFAAPACSCDSAINVFPNSVKVLDQMNVDTSRTTFIVMENETKDHPYTSVLKLNVLPSMFLCVDGTPKYSINDTLRNAANGRSLEQIMLDALNMYQ